MPLEFKIEARCGTARAGRLITPHGEVETPVFMPVGTLGSVMAVSLKKQEQLGCELVLSNTCHLYLRPGAEQVRKLGGLHRFMSWERALLTDSGGFQVFSLSQLRKVSEEGVQFRSHLDGTSHLFTPERSMEIQIALGADIVMAFDECTEHPAERGRARRSMEMTLRWAKRSKDYFEAHKHEVPWGIGRSENQNPNHKGHEGTQREAASEGAQSRAAVPHEVAAYRPTTPALFGIVQGGMYADLRRESAERTIELDFPGYAIGGLSVGESRGKTMKMIATVLEILPKDKPRYVMGVGYPEEIVQYAAMGVDMMECVLPTRAARHGLLFTSEGRINIKNARYAQD